jgi:catechol-2,3-dioxygenase
MGNRRGNHNLTPLYNLDMRIVELHLRTARLAEVADFYGSVLGMPSGGRDVGAAGFQAGSTRLIFESASYGAPTYHFAFNIPRDGFDEAKRWLASRVALVTKDEVDEYSSESWNARFMYFYDPAGNIVEFIARKGLPLDASGPFDAHEVLSVSEIGLPVDDVRASAIILTDKLGISPYQGQSPEFAALGDEQGLLIVVKNGRHWFPTALPATTVPVAATVEITPASMMRIAQTEGALEIEPL